MTTSRNKDYDNASDKSETARTMKSSHSSEERSKAASDLSKGGDGRHSSHSNSHGNGNNSHSRSANHHNDTDLSDAARRMRTASSAEERSKAASEMGRAGGQHSHDRDK